MREGPASGDALSRWLSGDGLAALDALTAEALDFIAILDRKLTVRYVNRTVPHLTREQIVGRGMLDLVPPDYREVSRAVYTKVLETGISTHIETMYKDGDDLQIWDVRVGPIRSEGALIGLIAITSNVTDQRREQADRDRFFLLSLDMLVVVNADGRLKRVNPAFGETLGYVMDELIGTPFIDLVHPDDRTRTLEAFASALGGKPITDFENHYRRKDGIYRVFSWRATSDPVTGDGYAVARDITDHRTTEAQLRQSQKMEAVGQLAGGIAHDFNNLLLAILANAELAMASDRESSETLENLRDIETAGRRAADLTKQLLAFSRRQPLRPVAIDLNQLIRSLMKMLRRLLPENIGVDLIPGRDLALVSADAGQLEQVIVNLCVNARDAMPQGGRLTIRTENVMMDARYRESHPWTRPGRYVLLSVTDTGVGMTPEVRERAFEPFFTTKSLDQGTGLGLSTVYGIVQQHGGLIHIRSELGKGATFEIHLAADDGRAPDVGEEIGAAPRGGRETILLAEDEELVRRAVVQMLQRAGYRTFTASNGLEAIRLLRELSEPVHLALLDVVMPELGGPEAWEHIRSLRPGLRVLFASGYADSRYLSRLPPDAEVVQKPFRLDELLARIRRKLDAPR
jgi:two-component system, cell cycle sensor histidine kinase and response regulator CckA